MIADDIERLILAVIKMKDENSTVGGRTSYDTILELEDAKRGIDYWYERLELYIGNVSDKVDGL